MPIALRDLGRVVKQLQYRHHREMDRRLRAIGTSLPQWDALRAISSRPNSSAHALAEMTFQSDQAFGALASRLIERGLIERVPGPGRAVRHKLTSKGEATLRKGYDMVDQVFEASFAPLTIRQREEFYRLLSRALIEGNPPQRVGL
ncbi:MAG TPA: MarR family transcriptional regulator [Candidatus Dormibacteraeota bacterium]|nr:MarR family transcriptional regulator [Candidatus Dormibacteraeota bacterium]